MTRSLIAIAGAALLASPAFSASYSAKPVSPAPSRIIARDITWTCGPDACQGSSEESRPSVLCQSLAKKAGRLESFIANGRAFGAAELDKCNSAARDGANPAVANR